MMLSSAKACIAGVITGLVLSWPLYQCGRVRPASPAVRPAANIIPDFCIYGDVWRSCTAWDADIWYDATLERYGLIGLPGAFPIGDRKREFEEWMAVRGRHGIFTMQVGRGMGIYEAPIP